MSLSDNNIIQKAAEYIKRRMDDLANTKANIANPSLTGSLTLGSTVLTEDVLQTLVNFVNNANAWYKAQVFTKAGLAAAMYPIGSKLTTTYTYDGTTYTCPWVILDNDRECEWADGTKHAGLWIGMKYATIESMAFDYPEAISVDLTEEPNALEGWYYWGVKTNSVSHVTTYTKLSVSAGDALPTGYNNGIKKCAIDNLDVLKSGYNRHSHNAIRQWLNSKADIGEWWTPQHTGDVAPSQLNTLKGFMAGFPSDFLSVLTPVKVRTACNTVTDDGVVDTTFDTFFPQSLEEVYGVSEASNVEGRYFPYWKQVTGLDEPSNGSQSNQNNARKINSLDGNMNKRTIWLRSATLNSAAKVWKISPNGYLTDINTSPIANYLLPACVIS